MAEMLFYEKVAALDVERHGKLKIRPFQGFSYAKSVNSLPVVVSEFNDLSKEYPIVFARSSDDTYLPVAVVGLREGENLFVDDAGKWDARYVPAFVRRYPFVPAAVEDNRVVLCIDEDAACIDKKEGEPLFVEGQPGALVRGAIDLLKEYQADAERTANFVRQLADAELFVENNAQIALNDGGQFALTGMFVIDERKLQSLTGEKAETMLTSGALGLAYAHLLSLSNLQRLVDKLAGRRAS